MNSTSKKVMRNLIMNHAFPNLHCREVFIRQHYAFKFNRNMIEKIFHINTLLIQQ